MTSIVQSFGTRGPGVVGMNAACGAPEGSRAPSARRRRSAVPFDDRRPVNVLQSLSASFKFAPARKRRAAEGRLGARTPTRTRTSTAMGMSSRGDAKTKRRHTSSRPLAAGTHPILYPPCCIWLFRCKKNRGLPYKIRARRRFPLKVQYQHYPCHENCQPHPLRHASLDDDSHDMARQSRGRPPDDDW